MVGIEMAKPSLRELYLYGFAAVGIPLFLYHWRIVRGVKA